MIEIKGKEYPFVSGRGALRLYARKKGVADVGNQELVELLGKLSMDDSDLLNWCCLKAGCSVQGKEFPFTLEEFQDILDESPHITDALDKAAEQDAPPAGKKKAGKKKG